MHHHFRNAALTLALLGVVAPLVSPLPVAASALAAEGIDRGRQTYEARHANSRALADALERESRKYGVDSTTTLRLAELRLKEAERLAAAGEYDIAVTVLDDGYGALKASLARLENARPRAATRDPGEKPASAAKASPRQMEQVKGEIESTRALLGALKRQNPDARGAIAAEIAAIEAELATAAKAMTAGDLERAGSVTHAAYLKTKTALAAGRPATGDAPAATGAPAAAPRRQPEMVAREIESAKALLEALKRQNAEKRGHAGAEIAAIDATIRTAGEALSGADAERASTLAHEAYLRAKTAIASLQTPSDLKSGSAARAEADRNASPSSDESGQYQRRRESVVALLATGQRIAAEKSLASPQFAQVEALLKEGDGLVGTGKLRDGRTRLDHAYLLIKEAVRSLRSGERLTAGKNFANPSEEFRYEQARNDDYQQLIAGVVEGQSDPSWKTSAEKARSLRKEAETLGTAGDHAAALKRIEESTGYFKAILRRAGFPIL